MTVWAQPSFSQRATCPPSAAVRQLSMALMTFSCSRLIWPRLASRQAGPWSRKISATSSRDRAMPAALYQPSKRLTHYGPVASANGGDASGLGSEAAPSVLAGVENGLVARKHAIGEEVLAQILPDVLLCVELRALGRQR